MSSSDTSAGRGGDGGSGAGGSAFPSFFLFFVFFFFCLSFVVGVLIVAFCLLGSANVDCTEALLCLVSIVSCCPWGSVECWVGCFNVAVT